MKKIISFILLLTLILTCSCTASTNRDEGITVVTTCFPLYDFTRALIGNRGNVSLLLKPGQDNHSYEPSAKDIVKIKNCDLFLSIGGSDEAWVNTLMSGSDMRSVEHLALVHLFAENEHSHDGHAHNDEHYWTSPKNAIIMVNEIAKALISLFPEEKEYITSNLNEYLSKLQALDAEFAEIGKLYAGKTVIFGDRFPFTHLFCEYGIEYMSAYPGCSDMTEPSASKIAELIGVIREQSISTVFVTELSNKKIANTLRSETGAEIALFHSCTNLTKSELQNGETYLSLMQKNVEALKRVLSNEISVLEY